MGRMLPFGIPNSSIRRFLLRRLDGAILSTLRQVETGVCDSGTGGRQRLDIMIKNANPSQALIAALPQALRLLRERAGYSSLRPAAQAITEKTGHKIGPATLSEWDRGTLPVVDSLVHFLIGLGYDFTHLQRALEEVATAAEDPTLVLVERLRDDPELCRTLRDFLAKTVTDSDQARGPTSEIFTALDRLGGIEDFE